MRILVIDTALNACTAAVYEDDSPLSQRSEQMAKGHQERIGVLVGDVVAAGGGFEAIDRIGVTVGPGSFTGLRVGLAFAQGLAAALDVPVVGISTLEALAWSNGVPQGPVAAVIDARRGQVYLQLFRDSIPDSAPEALAVDAARLALAGADWRCVGSGAGLMTDDAETLQLVTNVTPAALAALTLAADPETHPARPLYLRAPDATPPTRLPGQARPGRT